MESRYKDLSEYDFRHLFSHFKAEGLDADLLEMLMEYDWLVSKLNATNIDALFSDFDAIKGDKAVRLVHDALQLSRHVLLRDKSQLPAQLLGRLLSFEQPEIKALMEQIKHWKSDQPWLRPITPSYQAPGGPLLHTLTGHTDVIKTLALSLDGKQLLSASSDGLKAWDVETGAELDTLMKISLGFSSALALSFSGDGKPILAASEFETIQIWDMETGAKLRMLKAHAHVVVALALSTDGKRMLSSSLNNSMNKTAVDAWDVKTGANLRTETKNDVVFAMALNGDGTQAILPSSSPGNCVVQDVKTGMNLYTLQETGSPTAMALSRNGKWAILSSDKIIEVRDVETNMKLHVIIDQHSDDISALVLSDDGKRAISGSKDKTIKIWDLDASEITPPIGLSHQAIALVLSRDGKVIISASNLASRIDTISSGEIIAFKFWDVETGRELRAITITNQNSSNDAELITFVMSNDDKQMILVWSDGSIRVLDMETTAKELDKNAQPPKVWDILAGFFPLLVPFVPFWGPFLFGRFFFQVIGISMDGQRMAWLSDDKTKLKVEDVNTSKMLRIIQLAHLRNQDVINQFRVEAMIIMSGDGKRAVVGWRDQNTLETTTINVWDVETGRKLNTLIAYKSYIAITALALNHDSKQLISGFKNGELKVWDLETGVNVRTISAHTDAVTIITLIEDGKRVVTGSKDRTIKVWDLLDERSLFTISIDGEVTSCSYSSSQRTFIAGDAAGNIYFLKFEGI